MRILLKEIMGFYPLDEELVIFFDFSGKRSLEDELSWEELLDTLNKVRAFLNDEIQFIEIGEIVSSVLDKFTISDIKSYEDVMAADKAARAFVREQIKAKKALD